VTQQIPVPPTSPGTLRQTIAYGTAAMATGAITSGNCGSAATITTTGGTLANVATTDVIEVGFNGSPTAVTGYGVSATGLVLTIYPYPGSGSVNIVACNSTATSITPSALTLNWTVTR
jgi:hypothetical protein